MFEWLGNLMKWISSIWSGLSESTKDKIVDSIVAGFTTLFVSYYQSTKNSEEAKDGQS